MMSISAKEDVQKSWDDIEGFLVSSRYSVFNPETGEPEEHSYDEMLSNRIIPAMIKRNEEMDGFLDKGILADIISGLKDKYFIPATPFLVSFGNEYSKKPGYFSCYPLGEVQDNFDSINQFCLDMREIYLSGGGCGIDISRLRPKGSPVNNMQGVSDGPVNFMTNFDAITGTTNQGGRRLGALIIQMDWDHPDIKQFITCKSVNHKISKFLDSLPPEEKPDRVPNLSNMNISVNAFGHFWENKEMIRDIAQGMWASGDPGLLFIDNMLKYSPLKKEDEPRFSNPCGEYTSAPGTACNLLSVNSAKIAGEAYMLFPDDEDARIQHIFRSVYRYARLACYLGNFILELDEGYPLAWIREKTQKLKPVGVGMTGFHTALLMATGGRAVYGDEEAIEFAMSLQAALTLGTLSASASMVEETKHVYENREYWEFHLNELKEHVGNDYNLSNCFQMLGDVDFNSEGESKIDIRHIELCAREHGGFYNCVTTSQAPTGSISNFLHVVDTGIEPFFQVEPKRKIRKKEGGWLSLVLKPVELQVLFDKDPSLREKIEAQTAHFISPEAQLNMTTAFQKFIHTGVSKSINVPEKTTVEEIEDIIYRARDARLKGVTVYREGSLDGILSSSKAKKKEDVFSFLPRPKVRDGRFYTIEGGGFSTHLMISHDKKKDIREVFLAAGDVGATVNSIFAGLGMVISTSLSHDPSLLPKLIKTLKKISMGERFSAEFDDSGDETVVLRGDSIPRLVANILEMRDNQIKSKVVTEEVMASVTQISGVDICPECQKLTLRRDGSCRKCYECGYSTC